MDRGLIFDARGCLAACEQRLLVSATDWVVEFVFGIQFRDGLRPWRDHAPEVQGLPAVLCRAGPGGIW
eukprot:1589734-Lingulodinium_polyedra.AAC.1